MNMIKKIDIKKIPIKDLLKMLIGPALIYAILFGINYMHRKTLTSDMYMLQRNKDILYSCLAAYGLSVYLRFSSKFEWNSFTYLILLSMGYGLSAFSIASNHYPSTMLFLALLPIIFLFAESVENHKYYMCFVIVCALALGISTVDTIILFLYISIYFLIMSSEKFAERVVDYLHMLVCFLFSVALSIAFVIPQLQAFVADCEGISYPGFYINYNPAAFLSRFLTGSAPSEYFSDGRGLDLYFGMFFFITLVLFFFNTSFSKKERIKEAVLLCIVIATFQVSPLMHLIELGQNTESFTIYYTSFFTFYCIRLSAKSLCKLSECKRKNAVIGSVFACLLIVFALIGANHNFRTLSIETIACLVILYLLGIIAPLYSKQASTQKLLPLLIVLELIINTLVFTNQNLIPATISPYDSYDVISIFSTSDTNNNSPEISNADTEAAIVSDIANCDTTSNSDDDFEAFLKFYESHYATDMTDTLYFIGNHIKITDNDLKKYGKTGTLNPLEEFNIRAHLLGVTEDVFHEADIPFTMGSTDAFTIIDEGNNIFCLEQTKKTLEKSQVIVPFSYENVNGAHYYIYCTFFDYLMEDVGTTGTFDGLLNFTISRNLSFRFKITAYTVDEDALEKVSGALFTDADPTEAENSGDNIKFYIIYLILSACAAILLLHLTIDKDKEKTIPKLYALKTKIINSTFLAKIRTLFVQNKVYWLAFCIPCVSFIFAMIYYNSAPFGAGSFLDSDGISSVLATILNTYYNLKNGNYYLSTLGGYINGIFPGLYYIYYIPMLLVPASSLPSIFMILDALLMGFAGFSICYYLTHRLNGVQADKSDIRLLIPAMIYGLNNYMIAMHSYIFLWYLIFALLPILILFQERMIYQKKWLPYSLLLFFCILTNFNIAYYVCIFLVMHFFTCKFESILDFIKKGFMFAIPSILGALCNFTNLYGLFASLFSSREGTGYAEADSVKPVFGFFTSYLNQFKQFMIFSDAQPISSDNGHINIYMGLLFLLLFVAFFACKKISIKTKLTYAIPTIILFISFNEQITTYVFNGFHYQVGVPNRHAFLFAFLGACLAYEILKEDLLEIHSHIWAIYAVLIIAFLCICQFFGDGNTTTAIIASIICVVIYFLVTLICPKVLSLKKYFATILCVLVAFEMFVNLINACSTISVDDLRVFGDYEAQADYHNELMHTDNENYYRISQPAAFGSNNGLLTNAPSTTFFNSFLATTLQHCHYYYGLYYGHNFIMTHHNSSPLAMALSSCKYIEAPFYATASLKDLYNYKLQSIVNNHFVLKNDDALSLGIYVPTDIEYIPEESMDTAANFQNYVARLVTNSEKDVFANTTKLAIVDGENASDTDNADVIASSRINEATTDYIRFKTADGEYVDLEDAIEIVYGSENASDPVFTSHNLYCEITVTPKADGPLYLYANEIMALGEGKKGEKQTIEIPYPNKTMSGEIFFEYYTFDTEQYRQFITTAKSNQLENVQFKDNVITADIDYDEAGYTMFSLPFSWGWNVYIDDKPVEQEDLMDAYLFVRTPAGKHTLRMVYNFSDSVKGAWISVVIILSLCLIYYIQRKIEKKKSK